MQITDARSKQALPTLHISDIPSGQVFYSGLPEHEPALYLKLCGTVINLKTGTTYSGAVNFACYDPRDSELILR